MIPSPTIQIEPAGAYRTLEAGSVRGPDVSPPGRATISVAAAMARGLGDGWSLPEIAERCRQSLRTGHASGCVPGSPCPVPDAAAADVDRALSSFEMREGFDVIY